MNEDLMAEGYIREVMGPDLKEYNGAAKDEKHGKTYSFKTHILTNGRLEVLRKRFEVVAIIPEAGEKYFNVNVRRIK